MSIEHSSISVFFSCGIQIVCFSVVSIVFAVVPKLNTLVISQVFPDACVFFSSAYCASVFFFDFGASSLCQGEPRRSSLSFAQSDFVVCSVIVVVSSFGVFVLFRCVCVEFFFTR